MLDEQSEQLNHTEEGMDQTKTWERQRRLEQNCISLCNSITNDARGGEMEDNLTQVSIILGSLKNMFLGAVRLSLKIDK